MQIERIDSDGHEIAVHCTDGLIKVMINWKELYAPSC